MGFSVQVSHPSWPNAALPGEDEEAFTDRLAEELEQTILEAGPETIGAMIAERCRCPPACSRRRPAIFPKITRVLRKYGIQLFIDEVVTGFGRSGRMWATEAMGLEPDCMTCAKGISGAYMPIAGIIWARSSTGGSISAMRRRAGSPMALPTTPMWSRPPSRPRSPEHL